MTSGSTFPKPLSAFFAGRPNVANLAAPLSKPSQTRFIPLTRGQIALIDSEDFHLVKRHAWFAMPRTGSKGRQFYAATKVGKKTVYMHRLVKGALPGEDVDHLENDQTLDNRKHNLERCSHAKNMQRVRPRVRQVPAISGFRGVTKRRCGNYQAAICFQKRKIFLGTRSTAKEAALLCDQKAIELFGRFAILNFPAQEGQQCA